MAVPNKTIKDVHDLVEGEQICEPVLSSKGQILSHAGTVVTKMLIEKLAEWRISKVTVAIERIDTAQLTEQRVAVMDFEGKYKNIVERLEAAFRVVRTSGGLPIQDLREIAHQLLAMALTNVGLLERLALLPRNVGFLYGHTANVTMLSVLLGRWMGCSAEQLRSLALGGVMHDVGRCFLPLNLVHKYYRLTDDEKHVVESHCVKGYRLIEATKYIDPVIRFITLQHHERMNGSGYPCQMKDKQIHSLARIVSVADCFDLLMFETGLEKRRSPYQIIEKLCLEHNGKLCIVTVETFLRHCGDLLLGGTVQLNDGTLGRVIYMHQRNIGKPILQVGPDFFIDLNAEENLQIDALLSEFTDVVKPIGE